jgi:hypothetical protein
MTLVAQIKNRYTGLYQNQELLSFRGYSQESEKIVSKWEKLFTNHLSDKGLHPQYINNYYN